MMCKFQPANACTTGTSPQGFNLSRNKSLRTLEIPVSSAYLGGPGLLARVLSTIASPVTPKVIIVYRDYDFRCLRLRRCGRGRDPRPGRLPPSLGHDTTEDTSLHLVWFRAFHVVHEIQNFQLELCADVWGGVAEYAVQVLRQVVVMEKVRREFDDLFPEPLVSCRPREFHGEYTSETCTAGSSQPWVPL